MGMVKQEIDFLGLKLTRIPMLRIIIVLAIGILVGSYIESTAISFIPHILIILFFFLIVFYHRKFYDYRSYMFGVLCYAIIFLGGAWSTSKYKPAVNTKHFSNLAGVQVQGIVVDEPILRETSIRAPIRVVALGDYQGMRKGEGELMLTIQRDSLHKFSLRYGDEILFKNKIQEVRAPLNPREFDYQKYLSNKNIWHQCYLTTEEVKVLNVEKGNFLISNSLQWRQELINKFAHYIPDTTSYQIAIALIFGYRSELPVSTLAAFSNTGTIHVLSVSGLHVGLVFGLLTFMLSWMDRIPRGKLFRSILILIAIWLYVVLTGISPSVLRAGIMISFYILATLVQKKQVPLNTLFASAVCILVFYPNYLFDIGFQLSYLAMIGLFTLYPIFKKIWIPRHRLFKFFVEFCYVSIAAQLFTLPVALYYFGQFPVYFILANLFIAIPSTLVMYLGIALAFLPFSIAATYIAKLLSWMLAISLKGLHDIACLPFAVAEGILWDTTQTILLLLILVVGIYAVSHKNKGLLYFGLVVIGLLTNYSLLRKWKYTFYTGTKIYSIQQDLAIAHINNGKVMLFSTLDSITHRRLQFSVLPDLKQYTSIDAIQFVQVGSAERHNYEIQVDNKRIFILGQTTRSPLALHSDLVVWRRNNRSDLKDVLKKFKGEKVIIDGSNSQSRVEELYKNITDTNGVYLLKNNFAYVWDTE